MRTSDDTLARRVLLRVAQAVACLAVLLLVNYGVTLALEPYGTSTEVVWWAYREAADEEIDTILLGTSIAKIGLNPKRINESLGCSSWTLATDSQTLENSFLALKQAHDDHGITRAVIGLGFSTLHDKPHIQAASTFVQGLSAGRPLPTIAANYLELMGRDSFFSNADSLSCLFPWTYSNDGYSLDAIRNNIRNRMECATPLDAGRRRYPHWEYESCGYYYVTYEMDLETAGEMVPPLENAEEGEIYEGNLDALAAIARYCADNDIRLYVAVTPMPAFSSMRWGKAYPEAMGRAQEIVEGLGGTFMDFNMGRSDFYLPEYNEFNDYEHLNYPGAQRFSELLGKTIARIEAGEDVSDNFYSYDEWGDWLRSIDHISVIGARGEAVPGALAVDVWAWTSPEIEVEYQLTRCDDAGAPMEIVSPWSAETSYELPVDGHGTFHLKVDARNAASPDNIERTCRTDVMY